MKFHLLALIIAALTGTATASALRSLQDACAGVDERSQQCGATNLARPLECCEGLICAGINCVDPDDLGCANIAERAMECGIAQKNRPEECCEGLRCNADKVCEDPSDPLPTESTTPLAGGSYCTSSADTGCYETGWPECCGKKKPEKDCPIKKPECEINTVLVQEVDSQSPVAAPTEAEPDSTPAPTETPPGTLSEVETTVMTVAPTTQPTLAPSVEATDAATEPSTEKVALASSTSSASSVVVGVATIGSIAAAPLLLL
mmetsp:Transcript_32314/g.71387  ORF Transcript_32314/g.71387 Transcript_32314/m.71387 type:complete len:261 (-) Transcript_32314:343-1125(-)